MILYKRVGQDFQLSNDNSTREEMMLLVQVHTALIKKQDVETVLEKAKFINDEQYKFLVQGVYQQAKKHKLPSAHFTFNLSNETDKHGNKILMKQNHLIKQKVPNNLFYMDVLLLAYGGLLMLKKTSSEREYIMFIETLKTLYVEQEQLA
ncbi:MAG TPA: hypothetical protein DCY20_00365 [Firmicutes bacterium]|nr:hypothetical protein [Bacillota bacterium]